MYADDDVYRAVVVLKAHDGNHTRYFGPYTRKRDASVAITRFTKYRQSVVKAQIEKKSADWEKMG